MKLLLPLFMLIFIQKSYSQINVFTFNGGRFFTRTEIRSAYDKVSKNLPSALDLTPTIYHKIIKKDTVINYVEFAVRKKTSLSEKSTFKLLFRQDQTFLLLEKNYHTLN